MTGRRAVIAAGGTGGHMFPAQALAETLLARGWRVSLSTDDRGLRYAGGFPEAVARRETKSATFARGGFVEKLKTPFAIFAGVREAAAWFRAERPNVVIGFGGYPAIPALTAALRLGAPTALHEQNGVLGRVNRLFAGRVDLVAYGVAHVVNAPRGVEGVYVGNPLRAAALAQVGRPYAPPAPDEPVRLLVFGGSQGARIFADAAPRAVAALPETLRSRIALTQQVRREDLERARAAYAELGVAAELAPFFDDMPERIAAAHLVLSRAGASSIAELTAIGRPSILAPYPQAAEDHQTANAKALVEGGAALMMRDGALAERLGPALAALIADAERLSAMAAAAGALGRPRAAADLADHVERIAEAPATAD
ncbi:MAG: undecaprenyldiphospho-muramoylpentapeptide beta-N-acetylglucosaminyltransferase [Pseudomonadota bacterium]